MKKIIKRLVIFIFLMCASSAMALTINTTTDVGSVDDLLASALKTDLHDSSISSELDWVTSLGLGISTDDLVFDQYDVVASDWTAVDGEISIFAHELEYAPEFYIIKTGNVTPNDERYFLFDNYDDLSWAVIDLAAMGFRDIQNIGGVSHVTAPVPEPATMLLFGTGLVGLAGIARRKSKK